LSLPLQYADEKAIVTELVDEILEMTHDLKAKAFADEACICFVLDGEPLHTKRLTHKSRGKKSYSSRKKACKLADFYLAKPADARTVDQFLPKFHKCAYGWVRWFKELKQLVVKEMCYNNFAHCM
jgi:hypothetical protein